MKIKLLKDIPGFDKDNIVNSEVLNDPSGSRYFKKHCYEIEDLINEGWAEEVKDDIDIEAIRKTIKNSVQMVVVGIDRSSEQAEMMAVVPPELSGFMTAYRIVSAIIEQLNDGWVEGETNFYIKFLPKSGFSVDWCIAGFKTSFLPYIRSEEAVKKVIELCEPELKVLFGVK